MFGRKSRLTPSEVTQTYKGAKLLASFEEFTEYTKGFLDEDALQYAKEVLGNDADDIAQLKKIAQLAQDGSQKIGKRLSKEELKAGLDALWNDGGVEGALAMMERVAKLASVPREKKLALGYSSYLDDFAKQRNAHTWKDFPDPDNWRQGVIDAISNPDIEIVFNLDGMLWNGRMELWRNFNQGGDRTAFASGENFVIAFMGSGQTAHFDDVGYSRFASIDPEHCSVEIKDEPLIFVANAGMCIGRGVVSGLQEALGDLGLSASATVVSTAIGIGLSVLDTPVVIAAVAILNMIASLLGTIQSLFMIAQAAGGIYSTSTGTRKFSE